MYWWCIIAICSHNNLIIYWWCIIAICSHDVIVHKKKVFGFLLGLNVLQNFRVFSICLGLSCNHCCNLLFGAHCTLSTLRTQSMLNTVRWAHWALSQCCTLYAEHIEHTVNIARCTLRTLYAADTVGWAHCTLSTLYAEHPKHTEHTINIAHCRLNTLWVENTVSWGHCRLRTLITQSILHDVRWGHCTLSTQYADDTVRCWHCTLCTQYAEHTSTLL